MVKYEDVMKAKKDPKVMDDIYHKVFFDGAKPKLRMWLINKGVSFNELAEVESNMRMLFMLRLKTYKHDKIPFEKYCWTSFQYELANWFQNKKLKKNSNIGFDDLITNNDTDVEVDIGYVSNIEDDCVYDFEFLFSRMTRLQATICRLLYYNEWVKEDIMSYLKLSKRKYSNELKYIKAVFIEYLR